MTAERPDSGRSGAGWLLLGLAGLFAVLRLVHLDSDPSTYLTADFFTDEGWYSVNARNHALFGRWVLDAHNPALVLCPLHTMLLRASYALFGVSFWSTRVVGALASALTVGVVAWAYRRAPPIAALAAALVATQPILFALSRVSYCESLQLLFVTVAWALASDQRRRRRSWFLAGAAAGLALLAKASALYAPALVLAAPFLRADGEWPGRARREATWVMGGGLVAAMPWIALEWRFLDVLRTELSHEGAAALSLWPRGIVLPAVVGMFGGEVHPGFWAGMLATFALAGAIASRQILTRPITPVGPPTRLAVAWIVLSFVQLAFRPGAAVEERYWANLLVPLACIAAAVSGAREQRGDVAGGRNWAAAALLAIGPIFAVRSAALLLTAGEPFAAGGRRKAAVALLALMGAILVVACCHALRLARRLVARRHAWRAIASAVVLWGAVACVPMVVQASYTLRGASRALVEGRHNKVLVGSVANTLSLETPFRAFERRDLATMGMGTAWVNRDWRELGATHWIGHRPGDEPPDEHAVLLARYDVCPDGHGRPRASFRLFALPSTGPGKTSSR